MRGRIRTLVCAALVVAITAYLGVARSASAANEFVVSTTTVNFVPPRLPAAAPLAGGDVVVVWQQYDPGTGGSDLYGQRLSATGTKVGGEFPVASLAEGYPLLGVTGLADGGFLVVWIDLLGARYTIRGQRFSGTGGKVGNMFVVVAPSTTLVTSVGVAALTDGGFLVIWSREQQPPYYHDILAQRYFANGNKAGDPFTVSDRTNNSQFADVASLGTSWLVIWSSADGVYARRLSRSGQKLGTEFQVNTTDNSYTNPQAAPLNVGFVAVWKSGIHVYAQRLSLRGTKLRNERRVNQRGPVNEQPQSAGLEDGGFVVVWHKRTAHSLASLGCFSRRYSSSGVTTGDDFPINQASDCRTPGVVPLSTGGYLAFWEGDAIMARVFDP